MDRATTLIVLLAWIVIVLYPNPFLLVQGTARLATLPVHGELPLDLSGLPDDPARIEAYVREQIPYAYDFQVYGVPWYIPTPAQVVHAGRGDCKSRAILLAAIFEEKGIPYAFHVSPVHFWVDYPGREETAFTRAYENASTAVYAAGEWQWPTLMDMHTYLESWKAVLWNAMPLFRRVVLVAGIAAILLWGRRLY